MRFSIFLGVILSFVSICALAASTDGAGGLQQQIQGRLDAGEKPNGLIDEQSPYLLQHAFNPVNWHPWGQEAFDLAKQQNKPVFLSIGYSTCHWCHVMARESFEDREVAEILNRWFISIKVDREERPDIDQLYMAATQAMTGRGGWPMSVFLMADGSPFYAGTYFPVESSYNMPGFKELLTTIHTVWQEKQEDVVMVAGKLMAAIDDADNPKVISINPDIVDQGVALIEKRYDLENGGFGKAPKFPRPALLSFLFSYFRLSGDEMAKKMALNTLDKMAAGGMYDQLGGGFHRYSVDAEWFVPHFEKMLYDQAQLADSYLDAFQLTGDEKYAGIAREIFTYVLRDMRGRGGGFFSAEDADSDNPYAPGEHGEGAFYLWKKEEIDKLLDAETAGIFNYSYGVKENGNVAIDPNSEFTGRNILAQQKDAAQAAAVLKQTTEKVESSLTAARARLLHHRGQRKRPHLDDKVITAWNGMMLGAMSRGSMVLGEPQFLKAAEETAIFIKKHLYNGKTRSLMRRYRQGHAGLPGQLNDYAFLVAGLLDLYQASHNPEWLIWSMELTEKQLDLFWNEAGGFFYDSVADPTLKIRMRGGYDGAEPSGNSVAALNLLLLGQLQNKPQWRSLAQRIIESFSERIHQYPTALPLMLTAWSQLSSKPTQVVIAGEKEADDTMALLDVVEKNYDPARLLLLADGSENQRYLARDLPFLQAVAPVRGKAAAYVCVNFTCRLPVTNPMDLKQQLQEPPSQ